MTGSGDIGRLDELVDGAAARDDDERELVALLAATRALEEGAPAGLRTRVGARVRAAGDAPPGPLARLRARLAGDGSRGRRLALVGAPVTAALIAVAVAMPVLTSDDASPPPAGREAPAEAAPDQADSAGAAPAVGAAPVPAPEAGSAQRVRSFTRVRVDGVDALPRASARAVAAVRGLGGVTVARAAKRLVFRVPVARADEAVAAFERLGTVTGRRSEVVDVTPRRDAATARRAGQATLILTLTT